jgi:hypothetical protein
VGWAAIADIGSYGPGAANRDGDRSDPWLVRSQSQNVAKVPRLTATKTGLASNLCHGLSIFISKTFIKL